MTLDEMIERARDELKSGLEMGPEGSTKNMLGTFAQGMTEDSYFIVFPEERDHFVLSHRQALFMAGHVLDMIGAARGHSGMRMAGELVKGAANNIQDDPDAHVVSKVKNVPCGPKH